MAFPYLEALADYVAGFPAASMVPDDFRNYGSGWATSESFTVPAAVGGRRRINLDFVPKDLPSLTLTVGGAARQLIPYGEAPSAGEVAVSWEDGVLEFHSSDAGLTVAVSYVAKGKAIMAYHLNRLGAELKAVQDRVLELGAGSFQPLDATLTAFAALAIAANKLPYGSGSDAFSLADFTSFARTLLDDADAATARGTLGLGTAATAASGDFAAASHTHAASAITSGTLPVARGGTGASSASAARANLSAQASNANLDAISAAPTGTNQIHYWQDATTVALAALTAFGRSLIDDADAAAARTTLGLGTAATAASSSFAAASHTHAAGTDLTGQVPVANGGTGASDASTARTNLGLGSMATQAASAVAITGGSVAGITDLAVADGGTGASSASAARTNLGVGSGDSPTFAGVIASSSNDTAGTAPIAQVQRQRTTGAVSSGDWFGSFDLLGHDGTGFFTGARISARAEQTWTGSARGSLLAFSVTTNGSTTPSEIAYFRQGGSFQLRPVTGVQYALDARVESSGTMTGGIRINGEGNSVTPSTDFERARSGPGNVANGTVLGSVRFRGLISSTYYNGARIEGIVNGTPSASSMPTDLVFLVSASGSVTPTEQARLSSGGGFALPGCTSSGNAMTLGSDALWWRSAPSTSRTSGSVVVDGAFTVGGLTQETGVAYFGHSLGSTTVSVAGAKLLSRGVSGTYDGVSSATVLTNLTGGVDGQRLMVVNNTSGAQNLTLQNGASMKFGGADIVLGPDDVVELVYVAGGGTGQSASGWYRASALVAN